VRYTIMIIIALFLLGCDGPRGKRGLRGLQGFAGAAGAAGLDGSDGLPGSPGKDGDIVLSAYFSVQPCNVVLRGKDAYFVCPAGYIKLKQGEPKKRKKH